jgi:hypothetical protein
LFVCSASVGGMFFFSTIIGPTIHFVAYEVHWAS